MNDADWNRASAVVLIHQAHVCSGPGIVLAHGNGKKFHLAPGNKRMQHSERQRIVNIVAHIGVKNHVERCRGHCRSSHGHG